MAKRSVGEDLYQILIQLGGTLKQCTAGLFLARTFCEKAALEQIAKNSKVQAEIKTNESSSSWTNIQAKDSNDMMEKYLELTSSEEWLKYWVPKYFNGEILLKNFDNFEWDKIEKLELLENDCRSLSMVVLRFASDLKKGDPIPDLTHIHKQCIILIGLANTAMGYWGTQFPVLFKKTKGWLKKTKKKEEAIQEVRDLLVKHKGGVDEFFLKEAMEKTRKSKSRIYEYLKIIKKGT
jgi:hypothetical protein